MTKRLIVLAAAVAVAIVARADTWTDPDTGYKWTYRINGDTAEIYSCYYEYFGGGWGYYEFPTNAISPKPIGAVTIPSTLGGKPVTSIGSYAFYYCEGLTSVTIPNSVTSIGSSAFYGCTGLANMTIPDGVTSIGDYAFSGCSGLTCVIIPNSVTSIGRYAFYDCSASLFDTTTMPGVKLVDGWAIGYTDSLSGNLNLTGVRGIGGDAFYNCRGLTRVTIPDSVTNIEDYAFWGCSGLTSVTIPDSVTTIGYHAFSGCCGIMDVTVSQYVLDCKLRKVFSDAYSSITNVSYSSAISSIGESAFSGCSGLTSVTIPDSVKSIGRYAFYGCSGLTSVTIPDSVTSIGNSAFSGCSGLMSVTIPDSVTRIGWWAFYGCSGLMSISVGSGNANYKSVTGLLLSKDGKTLIQGVNGDVTIPNSVTNIGSSAFWCCRGLTSVTIPDSVTGIGVEAFMCCSGLASVTIPDSVKSIAYRAFCGCSGLTSVTIGNGVTSIGEQAFDGCSGIMDVAVSQYVLDRKLGNVFSSAYSSISNVSCSLTITNIGDCAFSDCSGLTGVTIGSNVTSIGAQAFRGCSGLTSVTIPNSVTNIGGYAFYNCSGLASVTIPDSVTSIGSSAFSYCSGLTSVTIPDSVTNIEDYAFWGCSGLTSVTIPNGVTSIGHSAFYECSSLTSVTIGNGVTSIGEHAFNGCSGLASVVFDGNAPSVNSSAFYSTASGCTAYVRKDSTGWGVNIPNMWQGLHIEYLPYSYFVFFHANGGTGGKTLTVSGGAALGAYMSKVLPKRDGYAFDGWWTARSGGTQILATDIATSDATYYAHWKELPATCSVFFHANGGTGGKTLTVPGGAAFGAYMSKVSPKRDGYAFDGWWTARSGGTQILATDIAIGDATYYAHWKEIPTSCSVFFHANGGTGGKTLTVPGGVALGTYMDKVSPKRDGYAFDGWWTARTGGTQILATDIAVGDVTYYAHWKELPASCSVFFHANGGTGGKTLTVPGGAALGAYMSKVSPRRDGYAFDGWWTARTGGTQILVTDIAVGDATYYAHWKEIPASCSIFFHANGGTGGKTLTVPGGVALGMYMGKVSPKRDGYTFGGWWTARTGGTQILATDIAVGDVTYYAHWTAASTCVRPVNVSADVSEAVSLANYYGYAYAAYGGESKMLLTVFGDGKATALVGDDVYQGELPLLVAPNDAMLMVVLEGGTVFGFQQ